MMFKRSFFALAAATSVIANDSNDESTIECSGPDQACWPFMNVAFNMAQQIQATQPGTRSANAADDSGAVKIALRDEILSKVSVATEAAGATDGPRTRFGAQIPIQLLANYGCWCYGGSQWPTNEGRSTPRDEHDDACKAHSMGMKCIISDAEYENKVCDPYNTDYDVTMTRNGYGAIFMECSDSIEDDWCRRRVCMVELRLLARYFTLLQNGVYPNTEAYGHSSFDPMVECNPTHTQGEGRETVCCGDYPYRSLLYVNRSDHSAGASQCCVYQDEQINRNYGFAINIGKIYNQFQETCTENGVV